MDYIGIVKALRKALADYTVSKNSPTGIDPTVDKTELIQRICTVIGKTDGFLAEHGFRLQELVDAQDFEKMSLVQDAVNAMCETLETKKTFQTYASELARLFRYADRDDVDRYRACPAKTQFSPSTRACSRSGNTRTIPT